MARIVMDPPLARALVRMGHRLAKKQAAENAAKMRRVWEAGQGRRLALGVAS